MSSSTNTPSTASAATPNPSSSISSNSTNPNADAAHTVSPLEQEVLDEYARLLSNINRLSSSLAHLSDNPSASILDSLRLLERKIGPVFTLLKASVYSIVLQQQMLGEDDGTEIGGDRRDGG